MYVIIGQGAAGVSAANRLRDLDPLVPITVISNENDYFYSRIGLPDFIGGKCGAESFLLQSSEQFAAKNICCLMDTDATKILSEEKCVELASGQRLAYTELLLATGSQPTLPPLAGIGYKGIHTVWTLEQARKLIEETRQFSKAVVVGAGLIGLKTALALKARGLDVTVIEFLPRVLPRQLDDNGSQLLVEKLTAQGIKVLLNTKVDEFIAADGRVSGVKTNGEVIGCDLAIVAVGVKPNVKLAVEAGLTVNRGIVVNDRMQTSNSSIYAAGDVVEVADALTGNPVVPAIWPVAVEQGAVAAINMAGGLAAYAGSIAMNSVEIAGVPLISVGDVEGDKGDEIHISQQSSNYKKIVTRHGIVRGVLFMGDIRQAGVVANLILQGEAMPGNALSSAFGFSNLFE